MLSVAAAAGGLALVVQGVAAINGRLEGYPWDAGVDHMTANAFLDRADAFSDEGAEKLGLKKRFGASGSGHPPTTSFWLLPVARLSAIRANAVLAAITLLLVLLSLVLIAAELKWPLRYALVWLAFGYIVSTPFMRYHASVGQFSAAIAFFYVVAWRAWRRGEDATAGTALGLACTMKLFPGVVVMLLIAARRWRAVCAAVMSYVVVAAIMTSRFGLHSWPYFFSKQSTIANAWMDNIQNHSVHGVILRLFYPVCGPHGTPFFASTALSTVVSLALLALGLLWAHRALRTSRHGGDLDVPYALLVVVSVVTSQWAWEHYTILYVLPVAIAFDRLVRVLRASEARGRKVGITVGAVLVALAGFVALWRLPVEWKTDAQSALRRGASMRHLEVHLLDLANWVPPMVLMAVLFVLVRGEHIRAIAALPQATNLPATELNDHSVR